MSKYHIGLDFGTYQTKACIYDSALKKRLFFVFPNGTNFIPSRVALRFDELFEYGCEESGLALHEFRYFKMASADDDEFRIETFGVNANSIYNEDDFKGFTPEFM